MSKKNGTTVLFLGLPRGICCKGLTDDVVVLITYTVQSVKRKGRYNRRRRRRLRPRLVNLGRGTSYDRFRKNKCGCLSNGHADVEKVSQFCPQKDTSMTFRRGVCSTTYVTMIL